MFTRIQLVDLALAQLGLDSGYRTQARGWLNLVIDELARNFDWDWYFKTASDASFIAGQFSYSVPSDFARPNDCYLIQNGTKGREIPFVDPTNFEQFRSTGTNGAPTIVKLVTSFTTNVGPVQTIYFDQSTSGLSYRLTYFRLPVFLSTDSTEDGVVPDFADQHLLYQKLMKYGFENQDDSRYQAKTQEVEKAGRDYKFNQSSANQQSVDLATDTFRLNRGRRYGGGWGFFGQ